MDFFGFLFLICVCIVIGIVLTLVVQYYVLVRYFNKGPVVDVHKKVNNVESCTLPEMLKKRLEEGENASSSLSISLMLQFLFHELRHSDRIKTWLYKKLTLEFDELLTKTTIGKFFETITIRDMHLGSQFPDIHDIKLDSIKLDKAEGHIDMINLAIDLDYSGNFLLSIDAKMKFGKTAYLLIKVNRVSGSARLQFTRIPYTHWSFSFFNEPVMELTVESYFQGRQLQSNITNLIVNQIKKAIRRKHTLPNYKIRYKPFFVKTDPGQVDTEENEILPQGQLEVSCSEVSRLDVSGDISGIYCTMTIDAIPFICVYQKDNMTYIVIEVTLAKSRHQQLGVIFKQEENNVVIDSITPQTPAANAGLKPLDVLLAVENKPITNVSQIGKIIKSTSSSMNVTIKVERCTSVYSLKSKSIETIEESSDDSNFVVLEKPAEDGQEAGKKARTVGQMNKVPKLIYTSNENMSKFAQTIGNFTLRKRKPSTDSSNKSTPNPSLPTTPQHVVKQQLSTNKKNSISEVPEIIQTDPENQETDLTSSVDVHKGKQVPLSSFMVFNDEYCFHLKESSKYLNVNIWGCGNAGGPDVLLGYTNIPISEILNACCNSMLGHYIRNYSFLPPTTPPTSHPLMSHSGFEHVFCYGDILLSFVWNHEEQIEIKRKNSASSINVESNPNAKKQMVQHDFVRTQFHRTIHCDFCSKKIWLKDAVQCRQCGLCCHKKCITKCQLSTDCSLIKKTGIETDTMDVINQPDIVMTEIMDDNSLEDEPQDHKETSTLMKRVNSVNNLTIPGAHVQTSQSRSLPPSPQRTPSRKLSLVLTNPFSLCLPALDELNSDQEAQETIVRLLDQMMLYSSDENLMETARESGRKVYANMPQPEKTDKINKMMSELKKMFDVVTNEHSELCKRLNAEESEVEKAKIAFLLGQADSKIHSLSVLMLHFCSALQQT